MYGLQVFQHSEFGELQVVNIEGKLFFPATASAKALGYTNPQKAVRDHCKGVNETFTPTPGGKQRMRIIPEGDLYRLIVHSRLPAAERFERWVFDEVLPTIRQQGAYIPNVQATITQAINTAVSQTISTMMPYLEYMRPKQRIRRRVTSLVDRLETPLLMEVEDMIIETRMSYVQISEHLRDAYGILISKSSIGRYAQKLLIAIEDQENEMSGSR